METILALDAGTSSVRCTVYSYSGDRLFGSGFSYSPTFYNDGRVRQSVATWSEGVTTVLAECSAYLERMNYRAQVISLTSQRASVLPLDEHGSPLSDAIMWQDKTTFGQCERIGESVEADRIYRITGLRNDPYFSLPKILWLKENRPEIYAAARSFAGVQDFVAFLLTGKLVTDQSQACRTMLMNIEKREWSQEMLAVADLGAERLPELVGPGVIIGPITPECAAQTGLSADTQVLLAGGDQQVAAVGMGVFEQGTAESNTGTGSFIISPVDRPLFHPDARTLCSISAVPGQWVVEAGVLTSGILYEWFAREFAGADADGGPGRYAELDSLVASSPPGSNGVILLPHFKGGAAPYWNPYAKGVFFNLTLANTKADMARAVLEGIILEMGANLNLLQSLVPQEISRVVTAGGLTTFDLFNQLQADIFGVDVLLPATKEASSVGALICALVGLGIYDSHADAFRAVSGGSRSIVRPRKEMVPLYRETMRVREQLYYALERSGVYTASYNYNQMLIGGSV